MARRARIGACLNHARVRIDWAPEPLRLSLPSSSCAPARASEVGAVPAPPRAGPDASVLRARAAEDEASAAFAGAGSPERDAAILEVSNDVCRTRVVVSLNNYINLT